MTQFLQQIKPNGGGENSLLNVGIGSVVIVSWGPNSNYLTS